MDKKKKVYLPAPMFRDPIYDCPTDPMVIWNHKEGMWYLFYTQRRALAPTIGVSWIHGTAIGVATSQDGSKWLYRGTLEGLDIEHGHNTFWAPEIIYAEGTYHMFVSYITGIPTDWEYPRQMLHYISANLWDWNFKGRVNLDSERVIDACIYEIEPHLYKMWYKDEDKGSRTYAAVSGDLYKWKVLGEEISDCAQEGPNVFEFCGYKWLISDYWNGIAVYRSQDYVNWHRCHDILRDSGSRPMDAGFGHHADVLVREGRAYLFYFCHPFLTEDKEAEELTEIERNKAVVQVTELVFEEGELNCDRNKQAYWFV
ncbi:MAG: glycosyl hydrolase [Ruminococcus flavefaciens]|nr:glycosyl hydrolase [Eubacterium sp.]MCM1235185.1 glycosyl hydrolase [Ruminococcus flavefaciens]